MPFPENSMANCCRILFWIAVVGSQGSTATWIRVNHLGWHPDAPQKATILSEEDLAGRRWDLVSAGGRSIDSGRMPRALVGKSPQNPFPYGVVLAFRLSDTGTYRLAIPGADTTAISVSRGRYAFMASQTLRHLRLMRSGSEPFLFRRPSHLGDSAAAIRVPVSDWTRGAWKRDPAGRRAWVTGGWYDAGDQIKFTLTIAYTTYFLLRAWEENPGIHSKWSSPSDLPDILDEAAFGLDYLDRCLIDDTTFVVQVGDGRDHQQPSRLPENDKLEGMRPALAALSPPQMANASAALALGARIFRGRGDSERFRKWLRTARRLHSMATRPGASRETAYWKDHVNDIYRDTTPYDNLALMAAELHRTTGSAKYLESARAWSDSADGFSGASWQNVGLSANLILSDRHTMAKKRVASCVRGRTDWVIGNSALWGYPEWPVWTPLLDWSTYGGEALAAGRTISDTSLRGAAWDIFDFALGRNPWGVSFFMSRNIPRTVKNIFNPIYFLNDEFPTGALAEGPGSAGLHRQLSNFIPVPKDQPERRFNTDSMVFFDDRSDFHCMETTIAEQAAFLYLLAALTRDVGEMVPGAAPPEILPPKPPGALGFLGNRGI